MNSLLDYLAVDSILVSTIEMIFDMTRSDSVLRNVAVSESVWAQVFDEAYSRSEMKRLAKLPRFMFEFTFVLQEHYNMEMKEDQYPHTQEDRSEYMVAQGGPIESS